MITGVVRARRDAVVELTIAGSEKTSVRLPFVVDTGFTGSITLPSEMVAALELRRIGVGHAYLGDGSVTRFPIFEAFIEWDGVQRVVSVEVAETMPLLGMRLLEGHELKIDVVPGGSVRITEISQELDPSS